MSLISKHKIYIQKFCIGTNIYFDIVLYNQSITTSHQNTQLKMLFLQVDEVKNQFKQMKVNFLSGRIYVTKQHFYNPLFVGFNCNQSLHHSQMNCGSVWNIICQWFNQPSTCCQLKSVGLYLYHCIVRGPVFDRSAFSAKQAGWRLASLSSCRHPLLLWHLLGWAPPTSPSGRYVVLRHHQCRSPLESLMHLKFKNWPLSLTIQYLICNKLCDMSSICNWSNYWR